MYTDLITAQQLQHLSGHTVVLDCRSRLGDPAFGRQAFLAGHLPGAQFADMDQDLAGPPGAEGRHPLPDQTAWIQTLRGWGIENDSQVVAYDDAGGAFAARAWWMLRWVGHAAVAVLDGGLASWSGELETGPARAVTPSGFTPGPTLTRLIDADTLLDSLSERRYMLLDARAEARWAGREEPIDPVAGHIPGALCRPFQQNLGDDGRFKAPAELAARLDGEGWEIVCYCGSGVTAAHNILAMHVAGLDEPLLYAGSWSGWITDPSRPVETAD